MNADDLKNAFRQHDRRLLSLIIVLWGSYATLLWALVYFLIHFK